MKKAALAVILGSLLLIGAIPDLILARMERCPVVSPQLVSYRPSIRCQGELYPSQGCQLLSSGFYIVEERYHALGETVQEGEVLAVLVPAVGEAVLCLQTQGSGLGKRPADVDLESLESLLKGYGGTETQPEALLSFWPMEEGREEERVMVTAPVAGVVTQEAPVSGSVIRPGAVIAGVEGREGFFALLTVGEKDAAVIAVGDPVVLSGEGFGGGSCTGTVAKIYPGTRKELSGSVTRNVVDLEVAIPPEALDSLEPRSGFSVKGQIFTDEERQILMVPYESIRQEPDNSEYILVAGPSQLEKRQVTTGQETASGVEIVEGLGPEELVTLLPETAQEDNLGRYLLVDWKEDGQS